MIDLSHFYLKTRASNVNISACTHRCYVTSMVAREPRACARGMLASYPVSLRGVRRFLSQPLRKESLVHFARACVSSIIDFDVTGGGV